MDNNRQDEAAARERVLLVNKINELESILGIENIDRSQDTWTQLRWRVKVLKQQLNQRKDTSTIQDWQQPIYHGEFINRKRSPWRS